MARQLRALIPSELAERAVAEISWLGAAQAHGDERALSVGTTSDDARGAGE